MMLKLFFPDVNVMNHGKKKFRGVTIAESKHLALAVALQLGQCRVTEPGRLVLNTLCSGRVGRSVHTEFTSASQELSPLMIRKIIRLATKKLQHNRQASYQ